MSRHPPETSFGGRSTCSRERTCDSSGRGATATHSPIAVGPQPRSTAIRPASRRRDVHRRHQIVDVDDPRSSARSRGAWRGVMPGQQRRSRRVRRETRTRPRPTTHAPSAASHVAIASCESRVAAVHQAVQVGALPASRDRRSGAPRARRSVGWRRAGRRSSRPDSISMATPRGDPGSPHSVLLPESTAQPKGTKRRHLMRGHPSTWQSTIAHPRSRRVDSTDDRDRHNRTGNRSQPSPPTFRHFIAGEWCDSTVGRDLRERQPGRHARRRSGGSSRGPPRTSAMASGPPTWPAGCGAGRRPRSAARSCTASAR